MFGRKSTSVCGDLNVFLAHRCVNSEGGGGQSKLSLPCIRLWAEGQFVTVCVCVCGCVCGGGCGCVWVCVENWYKQVSEFFLEYLSLQSPALFKYAVISPSLCLS